MRKGQPYIVGEKRPELFVPDSNGKILPSVPSSGGGGGFGGGSSGGGFGGFGGGSFGGGGSGGSW